MIRTVLLCTVSLAGCMASGTQLTRERAAFDIDFNCPQEKST
jgi:hypothetical protein